MAGSQSAQKRLEAAVSRLEKSRDAFRKAQRAAQPAGTDMAGLVRALEETQRENAELTELNDRLAAQLDQTIDQVRRLLETARKSAQEATREASQEPTHEASGRGTSAAAGKAP